MSDPTAAAPPAFGTVLRELRLAAGLSQEVLAERASLSVETIGALERGVRQAPYRTTVDLLAAGLRVSEEARASLLGAATRGRGPRTPVRAVPSLPTYVTSFVDRERERQDLDGLLATARMITICGPGGVGKTRLAIETTGRTRLGIAGNVRFVDLASLHDPALVPGAIAASAFLTSFQREGGMAAIVASLRRRELLLVFDNCEHLIEACAHAIEAILRGCAGARIVATSREPLLVDGETIYRLEPFADAGPAIDLFTQRARAVASGGVFAPEPAVARAIARRLDGIPLAIELAAALARTQSPDDIARMLASNAFLSTVTRRTSIEHQRTMEATLAWSYALLSEDERAALRVLAYPAAGTAKGAVEAVCGPGGARIRRLIDASLVSEAPVTGRLRLHEMTRQYVASVTSDVETARIAQDYARWLGARMRDAFTRGWERSSYAVYEPLRAELDNVRQALERALDDRDRDRSLELACAPDYWTAIGRTPEGFAWLSRIDAELEIDDTDPRAATLLFGIAMCAAQSGLGEAAREPGRRAAEAARRHGIARIEARCAVVRGNSLLAMGDARGAARVLAAATTLFEATSDATGCARALSFRALACIELGAPDEAAQAIARVMRLHADMPAGVGAAEELLVEMLLGDIARLNGDVSLALDRAREAAALLGEDHRTWIHLRAMHQYIDALVATGDDAGAVSIALPELERLQERGFGTEVALVLERVAIVLVRRGALELAARAAGFAEHALGVAGRRRMLFDRRVRCVLDAELSGALEARAYASLQDAGRSEDAAALVASVATALRGNVPLHR